jgi:signal transduction histidine kinase
MQDNLFSKVEWPAPSDSFRFPSGTNTDTAGFPHSLPTPQTGDLRQVSTLFSTLLRTSLAVEKMTGLLEEQKKRIHALMSCVEDGIVLLDSHGRTILQNETGRKLCQELCQCRHSDVRCPIHHRVPKHATSADLLLPEEVEITKNNVTYVLKFTRYGPDSSVSEESGWTSLRIATRSVSGALSTTHISLLTDLIAALAHEINNPLMPLVNAESSALSLGTSDSPKIVRKAGESIANVIRRMLVFQEMADRNSLTPTDLNAVVRSTKKSLIRNHGRNKVVVRCCLDGKHPDIAADPAQLRFFLENIVESILAERGGEKALCGIRFLTKGYGDEIRLEIEYGTETDHEADKSLSGADSWPDSYRNLQHVLCEILAEATQTRMERIKTGEGKGTVVIRFRGCRGPRNCPSA